MSKHTGKGKEHIEQAGRVGWHRDESGIIWKPCLRTKRHVTHVEYCGSPFALVPDVAVYVPFVVK